MAQNCPCADETLQSVDPIVCRWDITQIYRQWFYKEGQVYFDTVTPANNFPALIANLAPDDVAAWDILTAIVDADPESASKVIALPVFGGAPTVVPGAEVTFGGGNETMGGTILHVTTDPSVFSARYDSLEPKHEAQMSKLRCDGNRLEHFAITTGDFILGKRDGDIFKGIKIETAAILGARGVEGRGTFDANLWGFQLEWDWTHTLERVTPSNFSPINY